MPEARDPLERDLEVIRLELDKDGSPVSIEPRGWFVCIVPGLVKQWWHPFVHERHKHVFAMRPAGPGQWTLFEPWHRRRSKDATSASPARPGSGTGAPKPFCMNCGRDLRPHGATRTRAIGKF